MVKQAVLNSGKTKSIWFFQFRWLPIHRLKNFVVFTSCIY